MIFPRILRLHSFLPKLSASYHPVRRCYNSPTQVMVHLNPPHTEGPRLYVVDDALFEQHRARGAHPERPERLDAARRAIERCAASGVAVERVASRDATQEEMARAHAPRYLETLDRISGHYAALDPDTYVVPRSVDAAKRGAGSAVALVDAVLAGPGRLGVALLRPPGHHATRETGMGFCLLNNAAVAVQAALSRGLSRVAVVDFDVHHGNGTQDIFWDDPRVLFCSLHQWPFYPGTGSADEIGGGEGKGYTVNVPLSDGATDVVYEAAFDEIVLPILDEYAPELIVVSAGFDAHERDPLAGMKLSRAAYAAMGRRLAAMAAAKSGGRLAMFMEGGYELSALEASLAAALLGASGRELPDEPAGAAGPPAQRAPLSARHRADLDRARGVALRRWTTL
ncbi:histone deacetylase family protein [Sorangium sp. So ce131]|uniref:histone deacetylase family protein n=1 Tax=Sorangium sp. So ce131 TaxID=3133282 RepID=UPI003F647266